MGRPPLPLGTGGKVRFHRSGQGWVARCGFRDYDGVTRLVERCRGSKAAAERALKEALRDRSGAGAESGGETRLSAVAEAWWETYAAGDGSLGSKVTYRHVIDHHVLPAAGGLRCREFSVAVAERLLRRIEHEHGRAVGKSVRTVLSNVCAFAARLGFMVRNPVRDTTAIRTKPKRLPNGLAAVQLRQLRAYITYSPVAVRRDIPAVIDVMAATGLRIGECIALTVDAVDLHRRTVQVRGTVARYPGIGVVFARKPKTEASYRTLTVPAWVMPSLEAHVLAAAAVEVRVVRISEDCDLVMPTAARVGRRRPAPPWLRDALERSESWQEEIAIVLPSTTGTLRDPSGVSRDVKAAFVFAGLDRDTSHLLRRSVATQMDDAGVPVREIADQLGHARVSMTQDLYLDRQPVCTAGATALQPFGLPSGQPAS
ncbi:site-specific integrase [Actinoplanes sp. NPDC023936]|uniref:site-specific integrase n=1 Tax=Actinoplanes sp. NPDC023936 TaxID=3154910 RepID=UPI00340B327B